MARRTIYVFGSNEAGLHGAGTARTALEFYGAEMGKGVGLVGSSYAIPTKDRNLRTLSLPVIAGYVTGFRLFAWAHPELLFHVTKVGCGLAGLTEEQMAPMFHNMPDNVGLPEGWVYVDWELIDNDPAEAQRRGY